MLVGYTPPVIISYSLRDHKTVHRAGKETECFGEVFVANSAFIGFPCGEIFCGIIVLCFQPFCQARNGIFVGII